MQRQELSTEQSDRLVACASPWLAGAFGLAASFLALLAILSFLYLILAAAGIFQLLGEWARRSVEGDAAYGMGLWQALGIILLQSTANILSSLWAIRWGFVAFGVLGSLAGLATRRIVRVDARLGGWGSFFFFFLAFLYLIIPGTLYLVSGSEALLETAAGGSIDQVILSSLLAELLAGVLFALIASVLAWELWRLSLAFLLRWAAALSTNLQTAAREAHLGPELPATGMDDWRSYTAYLRQLKRDEQALARARWRRPKPGASVSVSVEPIVTDEPGPPTVPLPSGRPSLASLAARPLTWTSLPAAVLLVLSLVGLQILHPFQTQVAARTVKNWAAVVSTDRQRVTYPVEIEYRPQMLTIVKLTGGGTVSIVMTGPRPSQEEAWALKRWDLSEHPFTREYSIDHLSPGLYELSFQFEGESESGDDEAGLGYTYSQGGGPRAQYLGLAAGLMLTTAFVAIGIILSTVILRLHIRWQRSRVLAL
jgi:hypothetical protein